MSRMTQARNKRKRGFSLIEILLAVFVTGAVATILAATMPIAMKSRVKADYNNKATSLAQKQLEVTRALGYANLTPAQMFKYKVIDSATPVAANTYKCDSVDFTVDDSPASVLPSGEGTLKVEQADIDLRRVTVEISYMDGGRRRTVRLATLVANL